MDLGEIGIAAVYGAIGGGGGALLGALLAMPFRNKTVSTVLTVICVVAGVNFAKPLLSPYIGKYIGDTPEARISRADTQIDEAMAELRKDAVFAALAERQPEFEPQLREKLAAIVGEGGDAAEARKQAFAVGYETVGERLTFYVQRGAAEAILGYLDVMIEVLEHLAASDPMFCHAYLYDTKQLASMEMPALTMKIGAERYARQQEASAAIVRTAYEEIPAYDAQTAQLQLNMAGKYLYDTLGDEKIGLVTAGQKPSGEEDARAACEASAGMMRMVREGDMPADTFRHMMILSTQGQ